MEATIYATPKTVTFRFAREEEAFWSGYGEGCYFRNAGKHVHFTWNRQLLSFLPKVEGDLPKSKIGEWRFSEEGVRYQPVPSLNSKEFIYRIDGGQFGFLRQRGFEQAKLETAAAFEVRVPADKCPHGALIELDLHLGWASGKLVLDPERNGVCSCAIEGGTVEFGHPTQPPPFVPSRAPIRRLARSVKRVGRALSVKKKD